MPHVLLLTNSDVRYGDTFDFCGVAHSDFGRYHEKGDLRSIENVWLVRLPSFLLSVVAFAHLFT